MAVGVGLRVGTAISAVAVTAPTPGQPDPAPVERRTAVHLHADGTATLGEHGAVGGHTSSFTDFVDRVGRSSGVRANDGSLSRAEDLAATAMECLLADAAGMIGDEDFTAVATHPSDWSSSTVALLRNALDYVGLRHVSLISEAEAAAAWFESQVAHQTGRLVAAYHLDPEGATVTLVRSGVAAGTPMRFPEGNSTSVAGQVSAALGAFGWLVNNLDAVVVTADETIDPSAAQIVAQAIKSGLGVRCALAPQPYQTMVRGAALAAAVGSVDLIGSTQVLPAVRLSAPQRSNLDPETTVVISKITAVPPGDAATKQEDDAKEDDAPRRGPKRLAVAVVVALAVLLLGFVAAFLLRDTSTETASAGIDRVSTHSQTVAEGHIPPLSSTAGDPDSSGEQ